MVFLNEEIQATYLTKNEMDKFKYELEVKTKADNFETDALKDNFKEQKQDLEEFKRQ